MVQNICDYYLKIQWVVKLSGLIVPNYRVACFRGLHHNNQELFK